MSNKFEIYLVNKTVDFISFSNKNLTYPIGRSYTINCSNYNIFSHFSQNFVDFFCFDLMQLRPARSQFTCSEFLEYIKKNCTPFFPQTFLFSFSYKILKDKLFQPFLSVALVKHTR